VLARAAGGGRPLTVPAGTSALWAWIATTREPDWQALRAAMEGTEPHVRAVAGPTRRGVVGFRRSHAAALAAQRLVAGGASPERLTTHREVEVVALAGQDAEQVVEFVRGVLGPLAADDATAARLRETLRVYLEEGEHGPRAAARLNTHRNTVLHRIARAEELLGHPIADRRLAIALALELVNRIGGRALAPGPRRG
jgi:DNA-binding PucR family transcriptional regulator